MTGPDRSEISETRASQKVPAEKEAQGKPGETLAHADTGISAGAPAHAAAPSTVSKRS